MLSTENIGLKKPGYNDEADIAVINENSDIIDREFGNRYLKSETYSVEQANNAIAQAIEALPNGLVYRGAVNYYKNLPTANNELGDTYSVKYQGETGTTADGNEYAWGEYDGTLQWIKLGVNAYTKNEIDEQRSSIESDILSLRNDTFGTPATKIEYNLNLDTFIITGSYMCVSSAIAKTLINCPTQSGFRLEVKALGAGVERYLQTIYPNENSNVYCYFRRLTSNGWTTWYKIDGVAVNAITPATAE